MKTHMGRPIVEVLFPLSKSHVCLTPEMKFLSDSSSSSEPLGIDSTLFTTTLSFLSSNSLSNSTHIRTSQPAQLAHVYSARLSNSFKQQMGTGGQEMGVEEERDAAAIWESEGMRSGSIARGVGSMLYNRGEEEGEKEDLSVSFIRMRERWRARTVPHRLFLSAPPICRHPPFFSLSSSSSSSSSSSVSDVIPSRTHTPSPPLNPNVSTSSVAVPSQSSSSSTPPLSSDAKTRPSPVNEIVWMSGQMRTGIVRPSGRSLLIVKRLATQQPHTPKRIIKRARKNADGSQTLSSPSAPFPHGFTLAPGQGFQTQVRQGETLIAGMSSHVSVHGVEEHSNKRERGRN